MQGENGSPVPQHFHMTIFLKLYLIGDVKSFAGSHGVSFGRICPMNGCESLEPDYDAAILILSR